MRSDWVDVVMSHSFTIVIGIYLNEIRDVTIKIARYMISPKWDDDE